VDGGLPCTGGGLRSGVIINGPGVLDVDVPVAVVDGRVTVDGQAMPDAAADRGHLVFEREGADGGGDGPGVGPAGAASYRMLLLPGTYAVGWQGNPRLCGDEAAPVPCNRGMLRRGLPLENDGVLDVDLPTARVRGVIRHHGGALESPGGRLVFVREDGGEIGTPARTEGYDVRLLRGIYDVWWDGEGLACDTPLPCVSGPLREGVAFQADGVLDLDLPSVAVSGRVTLRGAAFPDGGGPRGGLRFNLRGGGAAVGGDLGESGPTHYDVPLLPGCYTIDYRPAGACEAGGPPCVEAPLVSPPD